MLTVIYIVYVLSKIVVNITIASLFTLTMQPIIVLLFSIYGATPTNYIECFIRCIYLLPNKSNDSITTYLKTIHWLPMSHRKVYN